MNDALRSTLVGTQSLFSNRLSRHTLLLLVSNIGGGVLLFALSLAIGRALGRDGLATYSVVLAWIFPLSLLVDFGLSTLATREVAKSPESATAQLVQMSAARLLIGGLGALVLLAFAPLLSSDARVVAGLRLSAPLVVIGPLYSSYTAIFKGLGAMWPVPWLNIGMLAAQVTLSLMALALGASVLTLLVINVVTSAAQLVAAWLIWRRVFGYTTTNATHPDFAKLRHRLRQAWPFALAGIFAALQMRLSVILLERAASVDEVAYFAAASRFIEAARLVPNALFGALFPALAALAADADSLRRTFSRALAFLSLFGAAVFAGTLLLAAPAIRLSYGDAFALAAPVLHWLALALAFSLLRGAYTLRLYANGAEGRVNRINAVVLVVQLVAGLWLIDAAGAIGAALALCLVEAFAAVWLWREQRSHSRLQAVR